MRTTFLAVVLFAAVMSGTARAQCPSSAGPTCSALRPFAFGPKTPGAAPRLPMAAPAFAPAVEAPSDKPSTPIDCKMLTPVDPQFASRMPIVQPAPSPKLPTKVVHVPPCKA
ncbi:MAG TPA: hypothetical protein VHU82_03620 [Vicinamibacterales bacterium]|jgi:hypothetical protein|nr:hypothetical protein [Vicinamibacterales bacterium]